MYPYPKKLRKHQIFYFPKAKTCLDSLCKFGGDDDTGKAGGADKANKRQKLNIGLQTRINDHYYKATIEE